MWWFLRPSPRRDSTEVPSPPASRTQSTSEAEFPPARLDDSDLRRNTLVESREEHANAV